MKKAIISFLIVVCLCITMLPGVCVFAAQFEKEIYSDNGISVVYCVDNAWEGAFNAHITINNNSDSTIENWCARFSYDAEITNVWNGVIEGSEGGEYYVKNALWNADIKPGDSVSFGFTVNGVSDIEPINFCFEGKDYFEDESCEVYFKINSDWQSGFSGEIVISNNGDNVIEDWTIEFDLDRVIESIWNGIILKHEANHYVVKNADYNQRIEPGCSVSIGINGSVGNVDSESMKNVSLRCLGMDKNGDASVEDSEILDGLMILYSDTKEIDGNGKYSTVYFYVKTEKNKVYLHDIEADSLIQMYDDGNYSTNGDDIAGDGVFSIKCSIYGDNKNDFTYEYKAIDESGEQSNKIQIKSYAPFSDEEMNDIIYVDNLTADILNNVENDGIVSGDITNGSGYAGQFEEKYAALYDAYTELKQKGIISDFVYEEVPKQFVLYFPSDYVTCVSLFAYEDFYEGHEFDGSQFPELSNAHDGFSIKILNCFEDNPFRTNFYEIFKYECESLGMKVSYNDAVTVTDLKYSLAGYNFLCLSGHGSTVANRPVFCVKDDKQDYYKTQYTYPADIKAGRVIPYTTVNDAYYAVTGDLISSNYSGGKLANTYVFSESCEFMGASSYSYNDEFAKAFVDDGGAVCAVGFYNSVMAVYSRNLMVDYFYELMDGEVPRDALSHACNVHGLNDYEYREPSFFEWLFDRGAFDKMGPTATPYMYGNEEEKVVKSLQNGDFETIFWYTDTTPYNWICSGDTRLISMLGSIKAYESRMVFITTGVGSKSATNLGGTQGSSIKQKFFNSDNTKLQFSYDFISEEPMEYVGSSYDDKFMVRINDSQGKTLYSEVFESVNKSAWYPVGGINFDGGDSTTYHTLWKTGEIDISAYCNSLIEIEFIVCDVGDSTYDSAVLLDNIELCK